MSDSPFSMLEPLAVMLLTEADNVRAASSNDMRVRVLSS